MEQKKNIKKPCLRQRKTPKNRRSKLEKRIQKGIISGICTRPGKGDLTREQGVTIDGKHGNIGEKGGGNGGVVNQM